MSLDCGREMEKLEEAHLNGVSLYIARVKSLQSSKYATDQRNNHLNSAIFCITEMGCSYRLMLGPLLSITSDDISK